MDIRLESARRSLLEQLHTHSLDGFGLEAHPAAVRAAGALVHYLQDTQKAELSHVRSITFKEHADRLVVDPLTMKHLEIVEAMDGGRPGSLLDELDRTVTPMGARLLRSGSCGRWSRWSASATAWTASRTSPSGRPSAASSATRSDMHDIERLVARTALGTAGPRDLVAQRTSLAAVPRLRRCSRGCRRRSCRAWSPNWTTWPTCATRSSATLIDEPPALGRDGGYIRDGVDPELDDLRHISRRASRSLPSSRSGTRAHRHLSLKVRYNRVFGYHIEVSKSNLHAVPADYHRKQTIAGGERFVTPALKAHEETRARRRRADPRAGDRDVRGAARRRWPPRRRASRTPPAPPPPSTCSRRSRRPPRSTTTSSRTSTTATS